MSMGARWGCVALIAYPLVELAIAAWLASIVGWWWVFVAFVAFLTLGLGVVRYALTATGQAWSAALSTWRPPNEADGQVLAITSGAQAPARRERPPAQTSLLVPAGLLIAVPGFVTTAGGLVMLLPPVRALIAGRLERAMRRGLGGQAD